MHVSVEQLGIQAVGDAAPTAPPVIIVGSGPVGMRAAHEILQRDPGCRLEIYGNEPWHPYNRIRLTSLLTGESPLQSLDIPLLDDGDRVQQFHNCPVIAIDPARHTVSDALGRVRPYAQLVLATGSRAHRPVISGIELDGVYVFRDLSDAQRLAARRVRTRCTVVIGGGLLGLEAARAMQFANTDVIVIEHTPRLMHRQLDEEAGGLLRTHVERLGLRVILGDRVECIEGEHKVAAVRVKNAGRIECDTVIIATGIVPNIELAINAGLNVGRGIKVDDQMRTSDHAIYAVGECAEHRGVVYGLVTPGLEQAAIAAHAIGGGRARYRGSVSATRLKVIGQPVFSMGAVGEEENPFHQSCVAYRDERQGWYRKLVLRKGCLHGAIVLGECPEIGRIQERIQQRGRVWPWQLARFRKTGQLWPEQDAQSVVNWPADATVCNCMGITRGRLSAAIVQHGCRDAVQLAACTGASTVCGSCRPLLVELVGGSKTIEPARGAPALLGIGLLVALLGVLILALPAVPYSNSVQGLRPDLLWRDGLIKQITGFTMLGLSVLGLLMSLRKRIRFLQLGAFAGWRLAHLLLGTLAMFALLTHTGLNLGVNLNAFLMVDFLLLALLGAAAALVTAREHRLGVAAGRRWREYSTRLHIVLFWPLPVLLGYHIVTVYYF